MQFWLEASTVDGFWLSPDIYADEIDAFIDGVVPILQDHDLFHLDCNEASLRDYLDTLVQYVLDERM